MEQRNREGETGIPRQMGGGERIDSKVDPSKVA
jgi:hypothetical protein